MELLKHCKICVRQGILSFDYFYSIVLVGIYNRYMQKRLKVKMHNPKYMNQLKTFVLPEKSSIAAGYNLALRAT